MMEEMTMERPTIHCQWSSLKLTSRELTESVNGKNTLNTLTNAESLKYERYRPSKVTVAKATPIDLEDWERMHDAVNSSIITVEVKQTELEAKLQMWKEAHPAATKDEIDEASVPMTVVKLLLQEYNGVQKALDAKIKACRKSFATAAAKQKAVEEKKKAAELRKSQTSTSAGASSQVSPKESPAAIAKSAQPADIKVTPAVASKKTLPSSVQPTVRSDPAAVPLAKEKRKRTLPSSSSTPVVEKRSKTRLPAVTTGIESTTINLDESRSQKSIEQPTEKSTYVSKAARKQYPLGVASTSMASSAVQSDADKSRGNVSAKSNRSSKSAKFPVQTGYKIVPLESDDIIFQQTIDFLEKNLVFLYVEQAGVRLRPTTTAGCSDYAGFSTAIRDEIRYVTFRQEPVARLLAETNNRRALQGKKLIVWSKATLDSYSPANLKKKAHLKTASSKTSLTAVPKKKNIAAVTKKKSLEAVTEKEKGLMKSSSEESAAEETEGAEAAEGAGGTDEKLELPEIRSAEGSTAGASENSEEEDDEEQSEDDPVDDAEADKSDSSEDDDSHGPNSGAAGASAGGASTTAMEEQNPSSSTSSKDNAPVQKKESQGKSTSESLRVDTPKKTEDIAHGAQMILSPRLKSVDAVAAQLTLARSEHDAEVDRLEKIKRTAAEAAANFKLSLQQQPISAMQIPPVLDNVASVLEPSKTTPVQPQSISIVAKSVLDVTKTPIAMKQQPAVFGKPFLGQSMSDPAVSKLTTPTTSRTDMPVAVIGPLAGASSSKFTIPKLPVEQSEPRTAEEIALDQFCGRQLSMLTGTLTMNWHGKFLSYVDGMYLYKELIKESMDWKIFMAIDGRSAGSRNFDRETRKNSLMLSVSGPSGEIQRSFTHVIEKEVISDYRTQSKSFVFTICRVSVEIRIQLDDTNLPGASHGAHSNTRIWLWELPRGCKNDAKCFLPNPEVMNTVGICAFLLKRSRIVIMDYIPIFGNRIQRSNSRSFRCGFFQLDNERLLACPLSVEKDKSVHRLSAVVVTAGLFVQCLCCTCEKWLTISVMQLLPVAEMYFGLFNDPAFDPSKWDVYEALPYTSPWYLAIRPADGVTGFPFDSLMKDSKESHYLNGEDRLVETNLSMEDIQADRPDLLLEQRFFRTHIRLPDPLIPFPFTGEQGKVDAKNFFGDLLKINYM